MVWNNGWINYSGEKNERSTPSLACTPVGPVPGASSLRQVWEPETVSHEQQTRAAMTRQQYRHAGVTLGLTASGELKEPLSTDDDPHFQCLYNLILPYGRYPKNRDELDAWGVAAGLDSAQRMRMELLYAAREKKKPAAEAMTMHPSPTLDTKKRDTKAMTFPTTPTMDAYTLHDIQATLAQVRAISAGTSPTAAVRTPVRPPRRGLDMVAMARVFAAFMQAQGDTSVRHEIAAARREVEALQQRVAAYREARRLTGRV